MTAGSVDIRWMGRGSRSCRTHRIFVRIGILALFYLLAVPLAVGEELLEITSVSGYFGKTVQRIDYASDTPLDRKHFDPYLGLHPGDILTRTALKNAIQSLYDSRRFSSIVAEAFPDGNGVRLRFAIQHNYYFNKFTLQGDFDLKGRSLWEWISLPVGKPFSWELLQESREAVLAFMKERGYYLAKIRANIAWDAKTHQVNVVFMAQPGELAQIRSIKVEGKLPESVAEKLLEKFGFREGKRFDRSRLSDRMEDLREYFINEGYYTVLSEVYEDFDPETNSVGLNLSIINYSWVRILVEGYSFDRNEMYRLLAVLTGEGDHDEVIQNGADILRQYMGNRGYHEAAISVDEEDTEESYTLRYRIDAGRKSRIENVFFRGCTVFSDARMLETIGLQSSSILNSKAFSPSLLDEGVAALQSLYKSNGYLSAEVDYEYKELANTGRFTVYYRCTEGLISQVHSVLFEGNTAYQTEELLSRIRLSPGSAYSDTFAEQDRQLLLAIYSDAGYLQAKVTLDTDIEDADNGYKVRFQIVEGNQFLVDEILVLGNDHTRLSVVDDRIKLKKGEPLSLGKLLETQQSLYRIGIFDQVRVVQQNPESRNPYQNIVVRLRESERFTIRYGLGYQEREKMRGILEFSDLNVLGLARRADIRLRGSIKEQEAVFNLRQTQFHPLPVDTYLSLSASYAQEEFGDIRRLGASYQFSQPINDHSWGMLRYNFKNVHVIFDRTLTDTEGGLPEEDLQREDTPVNLSTFSVAYINDSRDNYLDPTVGFFSSSEFGITTKLLGEKNYVSFFTQNSYFRKLPQSFQTAASLRIGLIKPYGGSDVPISERFFAGGGSSLRGFDTDYAGPLDIKKISDSESEFTPKGGNALFIGSVELRRPVLSFLHLAGFYDTGNVFETINDFSFAEFSHTIGAGLRIKTPLGPLRIDYGYNLNLPRNLEFPGFPINGLNRGHLFVTVGPPF